MKALTAAEMREVDRLTIERHGISGLKLMENAGGHVANRIKTFLAHWPSNALVASSFSVARGTTGETDSSSREA